MPELDALRGAAARARPRSSWRSAAAPTRAFLAWVAHDTLGPDAVRWRSPRCRRRWPATSVDDCRRPRRRVGPALARRCATDEMDDAAYRANDGDRCYRCKTALMDVARPAGRTPTAPRWCSA